MGLKRSFSVVSVFPSLEVVVFGAHEVLFLSCVLSKDLFKSRAEWDICVCKHGVLVPIRTS